ncbi:DUF6527 family protein [Methylophilus sp. 5]|uniref:DUF6527 family protein n=1 Tax=Methylophilus sp. 5 TaxID=1112274 RepID=UPI00048EDD48|nr:DUF6527 family protein [Methylophilus sp. 5]
MKIETITPEYVEFIPKELKAGKLYVSEKYSIAAHLCACGCGNKVVTPLSPASWSLKVKGNSVSLRPSIGNWDFPCKSHYWITNNTIDWSREFSEAEIKSVRRRDAIDKENEIDQVNLERIKLTLQPRTQIETPQPPSLFESIKNWLKNIFS